MTRRSINADIAEKAINQLRESAAELLTRSMPGEKAKALAARLSTGTWTHDYPITVEEAPRLGLNARADIDADVLQLMTLYPQPIRCQPTVEYLPGQRHAPPKREGS
jgi:ClpP class serine protease